MKAWGFVFILSAFTANLFSQENIFPIDNNTGKIAYSEVIKVDSIKSDELYVRAKAWFIRTFVSADEVIQLDDKEAGKIMGKGTFEVSDNNNHNSAVYSPILGTVEFTVEIQTKDERYKYVITDIIYKLYGQTEKDLRSSIAFTTGLYQKRLNIQWADIRNNTNLTLLSVIESLKMTMATKENEDEW